MADEAAAFRDLLAHNLARLSDLSAEWTSRLSETDRDWLVTTALNIAYRRRREFDPRRLSIVRWFESCMQQAAEERKRWRTITVNGWTWVDSRHLRRRRC